MIVRLGPDYTASALSVRAYTVKRFTRSLFEMNRLASGASGKPDRLAASRDNGGFLARLHVEVIDFGLTRIGVVGNQQIPAVWRPLQGLDKPARAGEELPDQCPIGSNQG